MDIPQLSYLIDSLPPSQSESFEAQLCYPGFSSWNSFWKETYNRENVNSDLDPLGNVHNYYQKWIQISESDDNFEFQKLWELVMIQSTSEAICETIGSIMNLHSGRNRHLEAEYFNMEMVLRVNLGPLHL